MTLTKAGIVEAVQHRNDFSRTKAQLVVETILDVIKGTLSDGEDVMISGFGKFQLRDKDARRGRNPATGDELMLPPRKVVTFKCSGKLRSKMNGAC
jgi:integration host factor subunit alpha